MLCVGRPRRVASLTSWLGTSPSPTSTQPQVAVPAVFSPKLFALPCPTGHPGQGRSSDRSRPASGTGWNKLRHWEWSSTDRPATFTVPRHHDPTGQPGSSWQSHAKNECGSTAPPVSPPLSRTVTSRPSTGCRPIKEFGSFHWFLGDTVSLYSQDLQPGTSIGLIGHDEHDAMEGSHTKRDFRPGNCIITKNGGQEISITITIPFWSWQSPRQITLSH